MIYLTSICNMVIEPPISLGGGMCSECGSCFLLNYIKYLQLLASSLFLDSLWLKIHTFASVLAKRTSPGPKFCPQRLSFLSHNICSNHHEKHSARRLVDYSLHMSTKRRGTRRLWEAAALPGSWSGHQEVVPAQRHKEPDAASESSLCSDSFVSSLCSRKQQSCFAF